MGLFTSTFGETYKRFDGLPLMIPSKGGATSVSPPFAVSGREISGTPTLSGSLPGVYGSGGGVRRPVAVFKGIFEF